MVLWSIHPCTPLGNINTHYGYGLVTRLWQMLILPRKPSKSQQLCCCCWEFTHLNKWVLKYIWKHKGWRRAKIILRENKMYPKNKQTKTWICSIKIARLGPVMTQIIVFHLPNWRTSWEFLALPPWLLSEACHSCLCFFSTFFIFALPFLGEVF